MDHSALENYFLEQQMSLQWLPFLRATAGVLAEQTDPESLRNLFSSIGQRVAEESREVFEDVNTIGTLCASLNDFLARINWGFVQINEVPGGVDIDHFSAPLAEAFGDEALAWSIGFLEGFYQALFGQLGASPSMRVRALDDECAAMQLRFRFGR